MDSTALPVRRTLTYPPPTTGAGRARANVQVPDEPIGGIELTRVRLFRFLLTNRHVQTVVRVLSVSLFAYVLFDGFFGPQDNQASFSYTAIWQVWWNPVMTISLLLVGRAWCYACPIGAASAWLEPLSRRRKFPTYLKPKLRVFGIGLSVLSISGLIFLVMRAALFGGGLRAFPWMSAAFFLGMLLLAAALTLVFRQRAFCRYVCPATAVMTVTSKLAPLELAQVSDRGVASCATAEFQANYLSTDRRCVACMNCTTSRPNTTVKLRLRWPGAAAVRERISIPDEALIALVLFAVFPINHVVAPHLFREVGVLRDLAASMDKVAAGYLRYGLSVVGVLAAFGLANLLAGRLAGLGWERSFTRFANAYIPPGIVFTFGMHTIPALMSNGGGLVNALAAGFGLQLGLPQAWASHDVIAAWDAFSLNGLHWLGAAWGGLIAWHISRDLARQSTSASRSAILAVAPHLALLATATWAVVTVMPPIRH